MPPAGAPRPDRRRWTAWSAGWLRSLDRAAAARPEPGPAGAAPPESRRVRQRDPRPAGARHRRRGAAAGRPISHGFDNIADALGVSPALLERYLAAAGSHQRAGRRRSGDRRRRRHLRHARRQPPARSRRGPAARHARRAADQAALPARRRIRHQRQAVSQQQRLHPRLVSPHEVEFTVDGERVFLDTVGGPDDWGSVLANPAYADAIDQRLQVRVPIKAGPARHRRHVPREDRRAQSAAAEAAARAGRHGGRGRHPAHGQRHASQGRFNADRPRRHRQPPPHLHLPAGRQPRPRSARCATTHRLGARAACLPAAGRRATMCAPARRTSTRGAAPRHVRRRRAAGAAAHPRRIRRSSSAPSATRQAVPSDAAYRARRLELASRLSFFLWSSIPDDELLRLAEQRQAARPCRARRAGAPHARRSARRRAGRELRRAVAAAAEPAARRSPDPMEFPDFDDDLRQAIPPRDRAALRQHAARGPQRPRPAARPTTRSSTSGWRGTTASPASTGSHFRRVAGDRRGAPRPARARQRAARDLAPEPHLAGEARQVGAREPARARRRRRRRPTCRRSTRARAPAGR